MARTLFRIKIGSWLFLTNFLHSVGNASPWFIRRFIFQIQGLKCGKGVFIDHGVFIKYPWRVSIGSGTTINRGVSFFPGFQAPSRIFIGENCAIAPNVSFYAAGHDPDDDDFSDNSADIVVEDKVWIGADLTILQGSIIESNSVIGAKSLVRSKIRQGAIAAGLPAKEVRKREGNFN